MYGEKNGANSLVWCPSLLSGARQYLPRGSFCQIYLESDPTTSSVTEESSSGPVGRPCARVDPGGGSIPDAVALLSSGLRMGDFNYQYAQKPPKSNGVVTGTPVGVPPRPGQAAPAGYPQNPGPYGAGPSNYGYPPPTQQPVYYAPAQQPYGYPPTQTGPGADTCLTACLAALCCCCLMDMVF